MFCSSAQWVHIIISYTGYLIIFDTNRKPNKDSVTSPTSLQTPQGPLSQPWLPSLHGWYVGRLVGALVGALVVGALVVGAGVVGIHDGVLVGELVGVMVGAMVGASVGVMVGAMVGSLVGVLVVGA